ncbi:glycosyl transferase family 90-domain-containing protein [Mycena floridula]|nr:glycosyl transferase family 90-domain-containing protein [Mycena floridula]
MPLWQRISIPYFKSSSKPDSLELETYSLLPESGVYDDAPKSSRRKQSGIRISRSKTRIIIFSFAILCILGAFYAFSPSNLRRETSESARWSIQTLRSRQSTTLQQATARYVLRNGRVPPPNYAKWFQFARDKSCLIDDYDHVARDFAPFYQLATKESAYFKRRIEAVRAEANKTGIRKMKIAQFRGGKFLETIDESDDAYGRDWQITMDRFAYFLPDMDIILNAQDEPRVLFNHRKFGAMDRALNVTDPTPFHHVPSPASVAFKDEGLCIMADDSEGFVSELNEISAFLIDASGTYFTTDLYPILSMTRLSPCYSDILVPSEYYYQTSFWSKKYAYSNNLTWENKIPKLYWRGTATGGRITDTTKYHQFPRFRLAALARNHTDIMDIVLTGVREEHCYDCDIAAISKEYGMKDHNEPPEDIYKYKYAFDIDGNSFSGRSLVFKTTSFTEFFDFWLQPYIHYIPILPDLSDLVEKVEWAIENDAAAREIQESGRLFAAEILTDAQNDCYFSAVLLEWARLQTYGA